MGFLSGVAPVVAVSKGVIIGEAIVIVVLVALLVAILVLNRRRKAASKPAAAPSPQSYYADLGDSPPVNDQAPAEAPVGGPAPAAQAAAASPGWEPAPPPPPVGGTPPPGTPAGWLPEPSGAPNTLRYWDGNAWTQHVAQRS
jgi:hypothetical protein